jgi:hypothetical protein
MVFDSFKHTIAEGVELRLCETKHVKLDDDTFGSPLEKFLGTHHSAITNKLALLACRTTS